MPKPAVTVSANHICPLSDGSKPHVGGVVLPNNCDVFIEKKQACRHGDKLECKSPAINSAIASTTSVFINRKPAIRGGDASAHGGQISPNSTTVFIG